jgi:hypothetical protein
MANKLGEYLTPLLMGVTTLGIGLGLGFTTMQNMQGMALLAGIGAGSRILGERVELMIENRDITQDGASVDPTKPKGK